MCQTIPQKAQRRDIKDEDRAAKNILATKTRQEDFLREVRALNRLPLSKFVVNIFEYFTRPSWWIILEFASGGELFDQIISKFQGNGYEENDVMAIMKQLLGRRSC